MVFKKSYLVDINAWMVFNKTGDKKPLYVFYYPSSDKVTEKSKIFTIETMDPRFKTKEGIHVGMKISAAEKILGKATVTIYYDNESREYVTFAGYKNKNHITFRAASLSKTQAAKYMQSEGGIIPSTKYYADSIISRIHVN